MPCDLKVRGQVHNIYSLTCISIQFLQRASVSPSQFYPQQPYEGNQADRIKVTCRVASLSEYLNPGFPSPSLHRSVAQICQTVKFKKEIDSSEL